MIIEIREVKKLLSEGKTVKVKTRNGTYSPISNYIEKGILDTFLVTLENSYSIKTSKEHKFFTNAGWVETQHLRVGLHSVLCDDGTYSKVVSVEFIGQYPIVDITVDDDEHAYFGNGMLNHNSGKSLLAAHMMANVQREGGVSVLIDTENAVNAEFYEAIGLDFNKMVYAQPETLEDIFIMIEKIIETVRKGGNADKKVIIVVDSVAGVPTAAELESDYNKDGYATGKAIILSKAMRKVTQLIAKQKIALVFTNQLRQKLNAPAFSDPWTTSGGKAIAFHASTRLRLSVTGKITNKNKEVLGVNVKASVIKNRLGPPFRTAEFDVYFDRGIDDLTSWKDYCKAKNIVSTGGAYITYTDNEGTDHRMESKEWRNWLETNPELQSEIYEKMAAAHIMSYSSESLSSEDREVSVGVEE
jgi:recombination protein RecA